jgi:hypothetical protein
MADGSFPGLVSKDRNLNALANPIFVQLSDGSAAIGVTSGALDVNIDNASIVVTATDLDIRDLTQATDSVAIGDGTDTIAINADGSVNITDNGGSITIDDGGGSITVDGSVTVSGTVTVTATDLDIRDLSASQDNVAISDGTDTLAVNADGSINTVTTINSDAVDDSAFTVATDYVNVSGFLADETTPDSVNEGDVGAARMTLDRKQLMVLADATTDANRLAIDASGHAQVDLAAVSVTAVPVSKDGSANSETNPIFVQNVTEAVSGNEVHDYDTASAVASDATDNHDYTVAGTTFFLKSVIVSGSGNIKFEIQTGPLASLTTVAVGFLTGRQGDTKQVNFDPAVEVPVTGTGTVRVIRTNRQGAATDLYSTIVGYDV